MSVLQEADRLSPTEPLVLRLLARAFEETGDTEQAEKILARLREASPEDAAAQRGARQQSVALAGTQEAAETA
jgi:cytochrome c-type biogenesis protein CcmH/NrfG